MTQTLRNDLYPILQRVKDVRLGDSLDPTVDEIFAAVREALTSDAALQAVGDAIWRELSDQADPSMIVAERAITAALDAITEPPPESA